jgi:hypothetical protein
MRHCSRLYCLLLLCSFALHVGAQVKGEPQIQPESKLKESVGQGEVLSSNKACSKVFKSFQDGIRAGNITLFSQHLASQVYVNLRGGESGYYSDNQVHYVLRNYLRAKRLASFDFTTVGESESNPYATGSAVFIVKGTREIAQVYVSLSFAGERWVITQINIY